jgi:hypothetical protein
MSAEPKQGTIHKFESGVYILINDTFTGIRKMARVSDTGMSYYDLDEEGATLFPIYTQLEPEEVGNILGWGLDLVDKKPGLVDGFRALVDRLVNSGRDVLTYNRAAYWAYKNGNFDFAQAIAHGETETATVKAGRVKMDAIIKSAGVL